MGERTMYIVYIYDYDYTTILGTIPDDKADEMKEWVKNQDEYSMIIVEELDCFKSTEEVIDALKKDQRYHD